MPKEWEWKDNVIRELECDVLFSDEEKEMLKNIFKLRDKTEVCAYLIEKLEQGDEKVCRVLEKLTNKIICKGKF